MIYVLCGVGSLLTLIVSGWIYARKAVEWQRQEEEIQKSYERARQLQWVNGKWQYLQSTNQLRKTG